MFKTKFNHLPQLVHVLPRDLQGVARAAVQGHLVGAAPQHCYADGLRAAGVPELVLHLVAQWVYFSIYTRIV